MTESAEETRLTIRRRIPARREKGFDAWLDAEGMRTWMAPGTAQGATAEIDPRVGEIVFTRVSDGTNQRESGRTLPDRKRTADHAEGWTRFVELLLKDVAPKQPR